MVWGLLRELYNIGWIIVIPFKYMHVQIGERIWWFFHYLPIIFGLNINGEELFSICLSIDAALLFSFMKRCEMVINCKVNIFFITYTRISRYSIEFLCAYCRRNFWDRSNILYILIFTFLSNCYIVVCSSLLPLS